MNRQDLRQEINRVIAIVVMVVVVGGAITLTYQTVEEGRRGDLEVQDRLLKSNAAIQEAEILLMRDKPTGGR